MAEVPEGMLYEDLRVQISFVDRRPSFGDLFEICGGVHPSFPPTGSFGFSALQGLQFEQVDDYFGVRSLSEDGDGVVVWLFPLVEGTPVHHHVGPFDGLRLEYCVLRNPARHAQHFLRCVHEFSATGIGVRYRGDELGNPPDMGPIRRDIDAVVRHWAARNIVVGSPEALRLNR